MKVLQVNSYYKEGSTGKILDDIHAVLLKDGYESVICYTKGHDYSDLPHIYKISKHLEKQIHRYANRILGVYMYGGLYSQTRELLRIINKEKPDVVHLHCVNGNSFNIYKILSYLASNNIRTVVTNHAEFFYTGNCGYSFACEKWKNNPGCGHCPNLLISTGSHFFDWTKSAWKTMKCSFDKFDSDRIKIASVSPWVKKRALKSPIQSRFDHHVVLNGVDTDIFHLYNKENIYSSIKSDSSRPTVFHATASFNPSDNASIKGAKFLVEIAQKMPEVDFVVAAIDYKITEKLPDNILFWGPAKTQIELAKLYSEADCTLLVSMKETFSMPTAETLCCGTPIVGFNAGGPESFAPKQYADFVEYGNVDLLCQFLKIRLATGHDKEKISQYATQEFSKENMANSYINIYKSLCSKT